MIERGGNSGYNAQKTMGETMRNCFEPGKVWLDTDGKRIHAHGGSILYENGTYYWYGENKEHSDGKNGVWHWGVRCYSSRDLYNWKDEGVIIPPDLNDETSPRWRRTRSPSFPSARSVTMQTSSKRTGRSSEEIFPAFSREQ